MTSAAGDARPEPAAGAVRSAGGAPPPEAPGGVADSAISRPGRRPSWLDRVAGEPLTLVTLCLVLALFPRVYGLNLVYTSDEGYWMQRSVRFAGALLTGNFAETYRSGHPGVTVMWTGMLGVGPSGALAYADERAASAPTLERAAGFNLIMAEARTAVAIFVAALLALAGYLAFRLLGPGGALGALLLILDPYVVGMTRLLHVDALLAPLMLVSTLAGLVYWLRGRQWPYLAVSGVAAGLALLTKAPASILLPFFGLVWLAEGQPWRRSAAPGGWRTVWLGPLAWGLLAALVYVALWPTLWVQPVERLTELARFVLAVGGVPHNWPTFFLGQPTTGDPGPLFYPIAMLFRLGPVESVGLLLLVGLALARRPVGGAAVSWLAVFVVVFAWVMTLGAKKFDRYMLPALLVLDLLAGVGIWQALRLLAGWRPGPPASRLAVAGAVLAVMAQASWLAVSYPYPIAAYNPLLGGTAAARQVIMVGWGEGLEQAAAYLNSRPNAARLNASTQYHHVLRPRFVGGTPRVPTSRVVDYYVVYVNMVQRDIVPAPVKQTMAASPPAFTAMVNGVPFAWVYRGPWVLDTTTVAPTDTLDDSPADRVDEPEQSGDGE